MAMFPSPLLTVADVLRRQPRAAAVFYRRRLACPGCAMAPFDTLRDVAAAYDLELTPLLAELAEVANERAPRNERRPS
jgi:hybrid cluster-associated redox disulfide protein